MTPPLPTPTASEVRIARLREYGKMQQGATNLAWWMSQNERTVASIVRLRKAKTAIGMLAKQFGIYRSKIYEILAAEGVKLALPGGNLSERSREADRELAAEAQMLGVQVAELRAWRGGGQA